MSLTSNFLIRRALFLLIVLTSPRWGSAKELLTNGGFENDVAKDGLPDGWSFLEGKVSLTTEKVASGKVALEAFDAGPKDSVSIDSTHVPCDESHYYLARVKLRSDGVARPSFYLQFFNEQQQRIGFVHKFAPPVKEWTLVSLAAQPPAEARFVSVLLFSGAGEAGTFQADDASLMEWSREDLGDRSGVLPNAGFEVVDPSTGAPAGYQEVTGGVSLSGEGPHGGQRALQLVRLRDEDSVPGLRSFRFPTTPGQKWRADGWIKQDLGAQGCLTVEFWDLYSRPLGSAKASANASDAWAQAQIETVAPDGTVTVSLHLSATPESKGTIYVDDLTMKRMPREGPEVLDIGTHRQLFIDDYLIDTMDGMERIYHPATKRPEPAIVADKPWEKPSFLGVLGNCIFFDETDRLYKMYYVIYQLIVHSERQHVALATSKDGLRWEKPNLGVADYKGSRDNNLLWDFESPRYAVDWWSYNNILKDNHDPDPQRRYKALGMWMRFDKQGKHSGYGMLVAFSPDGLHWTEPPENPVLPNGDTHTLLGWDDTIQKYVAYPRTAVPGCGRCIGYSTSDDFLRWTDAKTVMQPDPADPPHFQIYGMPVFQYEGLYLGLPWAFLEAGTEPLDTQLAVSRDGVQWQKVANGRMFVPRGPAGSFDDSYALCANPIQVGDELLFYYMGCGFPHGPQFVKESKWEGSIGLARLRLDGFVSLSCSMDSGGTLLTRPVRFTGRRMVVNCDCPKGWLRVELTDEEGQPIPGFTENDCDPVQADSVRRVVTWTGKNDVSALAGKPIRVKLRIGDGDVYSFGFAP